MSNNGTGLGEKLQSLPKIYLYILLIGIITLALFKPMKVPNEPQDQSIDFYANMMSLKEGSTVLLASDWTNSTRGESSGSAEAVLKILIRKKIKFAMFSTGDPQAPAVMRDMIVKVAKEEEDAKEAGYSYKRWEDWVSLGYYPNSEAQNNSIANDVRKAFAGRNEYPGGVQKSVWESPVLQNIQKLSDFSMMILISPSSTDKITIERISGKIKPLQFAVTGVMVPENQNYYSAGQIQGLIGGLKGVYDMETLMENGINNPGPDGKVVVSSSKIQGSVPGFAGKKNDGRGTRYYPTLHIAIGLMFIAVIVGNIGMFLSKRAK